MMFVPPQMFCKILISRLIYRQRRVKPAKRSNSWHDHSAHLFLFDRLENFDYASLVVDDVHALKHFTVFASAHLSDNFIVVLIPVAVFRA